MRIIFPTPPGSIPLSAAHTLSVESPAIPVIQGEPALVPIGLSGRDGINRLFEYELLVQTPDALNFSSAGAANFDLDEFIGQPIDLAIEIEGGVETVASVFGRQVFQLGAGTRHLNALISHASVWKEEGRHVQYLLVLRPWLDLATVTADCKIFQNLSVVQILDELLANYNFPVSKRLVERYAKRDYQTQFNETDFEFFERLCQEWGINYLFEHEQGVHRLVLVDRVGVFEPQPGAAYREVEYHPPGWKAGTEYIHAFVLENRLSSGRYATRDSDYMSPRSDLSISRSDPGATAHAEQEVYQWHHPHGGCHFAQPRAGTGDNEPLEEGRHLARLRMEGLRTASSRARMEGHLRGMVPGCFFTLRGHPRDDANVKWLVLDCELRIDDLGQASQVADAAPGRARVFRMEAKFTAHPMSRELRPALTRRKPSGGQQFAVVVGPEGENLWTDELGRVKVQFPWDRKGRNDQNSSCWLRVASTWAGNQLGAVQVPRIGQEVLVGFIGDDPDLPLVTGLIHNQLNLPPWALPGQSALSGMRSRELTRGGGNSSAGRSNHLVFDDTEEKIQVQLRSDHQSSSLSLGHITRIEGHAGRKDPRGEGFELRSDAHGAIRARRGLLITTESRENARAHLLDSAETAERLVRARHLHESGGDLAQKSRAQAASDQEAVAKVLKKQCESLQGQGGSGADADGFPELTAPDLVLASPSGIETTSQGSTHLASGEHTAITSAAHTSIASGDSLLAVALQAMKLFAAQKDISIVAGQADIDLQALKACVNLLAGKQVRIQAEAILVEATKELMLDGGGSYLRLSGAGIESGTAGTDVRHAASHAMTGPKARPVTVPVFGTEPVKPIAPQERDLHFFYHDMQPVHGASFRIEYADGQVHEGTFDDQGRADLSQAPVGNGRIRLGEDVRPYELKATKPNPNYKAEWTESDMARSWSKVNQRADKP